MQEIESAPQTNTVVSLAGAGAPSPADGGAQPAANPVPQAGATQQVILVTRPGCV